MISLLINLNRRRKWRKLLKNSPSKSLLNKKNKPFLSQKDSISGTNLKRKTIHMYPLSRQRRKSQKLRRIMVRNLQTKKNISQSFRISKKSPSRSPKFLKLLINLKQRLKSQSRNRLFLSGWEIDNGLITLKKQAIIPQEISLRRRPIRKTLIQDTIQLREKQANKR